MLESNYLGMLVKSNYEKPMDSAVDVLERGVDILWFPGYKRDKDMALNQNESIIIKKLAEKVYVAEVSKKSKFDHYHI